jgi:ribonuclease P/MRP protein subunit POP1
VIIPSGYGLSVWLSLIRCGAKSGGWQEIETVTNEMGTEVHLPDTVSGKHDIERCLKLKRAKYFQRPPNKRTNYKKMGIASPFICPFQQLVREWNGGDNFHVLRNLTTLRKFDDVLKGRQKIQDLNVPAAALIPIYTVMDTRGVPGDNGLICLPTKRDIKNCIAQKYLRNSGPVFVEPLIRDETEQERKSIRMDHKKLLKRLRNRRVRAKRRLQATANYNVKIQKSSAENLIEQQYQKMCELWLPECPPTVRRQCSKQVFGYLTKSRFTFSNGKVCGVGYITKDGFVELQRTFSKFKGLQPFVLTRSITSRFYQRANLKIRCNI